MNYYLILGIEADASRAEIKEAYRKMAQKFHPDHFGEDSSPFLRVQEAYQVLSDPVRRKKYDQTLSKTQSPTYQLKNRISGRYSQEPEPLIPKKRIIREEPLSLSRSFETYSSSFDEIFERLFLNFGLSERQKSERVENLKVEVTINHEQAETGGSLQLLIPVQINCPLCHGTGFIGLWECHKCTSVGSIETEIPLIVSYPGGIQNTYTKSISLNKFGIDNFYITVCIRVSA